MIKVFKSRHEAIQLEIKLHTRMEVGTNNSFYNKCKQTSVGFDTTGVKYVFSKEHLANMQLSRYGRVISNEQKCKIRNTLVKNNTCKGKNNPRAEIISIFNADGDLQHICHGDFKEVCNRFKLPCLGLANTYRRNTYLYENITDAGNIVNLTNKNMYQYKGWYARKGK